MAARVVAIAATAEAEEEVAAREEVAASRQQLQLQRLRWPAELAVLHQRGLLLHLMKAPPTILAPRSLMFQQLTNRLQRFSHLFLLELVSPGRQRFCHLHRSHQRTLSSPPHVELVSPGVPGRQRSSHLFLLANEFFEWPIYLQGHIEKVTYESTFRLSATNVVSLS